MGCTGSRHALRGGVRKSFARSRSGPATVHHTVALKSSTLGSLSLDRNEEMIKWRAGAVAGAKGEELGERVKKREIQRFPGIVRARVSAFQQRIDAKLAKMARPPTPTSPPPPPPPMLPPPPDSHRKVVLYLTSLRGIRKTFEDCWATKSILHGYGVRVDERDLSLHGGFKDELHASLGAAGRLPQVFVDGKHLGGADDVRRMHEAGELSKALEACEMAPSGVGDGKGVAAGLEGCSGCGGVRFVPCEECSGSYKVFLEELDSFRRCPECNENGLPSLLS